MHGHSSSHRLGTLKIRRYQQRCNFLFGLMDTMKPQVSSPQPLCACGALLRMARVSWPGCSCSTSGISEHTSPSTAHTIRGRHASTRSGPTSPSTLFTGKKRDPLCWPSSSDLQYFLISDGALDAIPKNARSVIQRMWLTWRLTIQVYDQFGTESEGRLKRPFDIARLCGDGGRRLVTARTAAGGGVPTIVLEGNHATYPWPTMCRSALPILAYLSQ